MVLNYASLPGTQTGSRWLPGHPEWHSKEFRWGPDTRAVLELISGPCRNPLSATRTCFHAPNHGIRSGFQTPFSSVKKSLPKGGKQTGFDSQIAFDYPD